MKADNDILVRLIVKKVPCNVAYSSMRVQRTDFPVITCAVACVNGEYRAAIGARPTRARLYRDETGLVAGAVTPEEAKAFAAWVGEQAPTQSNIRGSAAYRTHLIKVLTERSLLELGGVGHGN